MTASLDPALESMAPSLFNPRAVLIVALLAILALLPVYSLMTGDTFVLTLFTRIVILAIGAVSLNLIMGYGGMVSFGHAAYLGIGGYAVGILAKEGIGSGSGAMAGGDCGFGSVRAGGRRAQPAHAWRLFHHDHARLCADDLLCRDRARPVWRRRWPDHLQAQPVAASSISTTRRCSTTCAFCSCLAPFIWSRASSIPASAW